MSNKYSIKVLDCTLRDGGRVFDCNFSDKIIKKIIKNLFIANIDIIEIGFLRNKDIKVHNKSDTFFNTIEEAEKMIPNGCLTEYALFIDHGLYNVDELLKVNTKTKIRNLRYAFTKNDYNKEFFKIEENIKLLIEKGYNLFLQPINILSYSKKDLFNLIRLANKYRVKSFAIVDTYGSLYDEDLNKILSYLNKKLKKRINLVFHSHNSYQLSFALAQSFINNSSNRNIIIDATLSGIGKCAGNLPIELICTYLNKKYNMTYNLDKIYNLNDEIILKYKDKYDWGYNQYTLIQGEYQVHPNNIIYLQSKKVNLIETKHILSKLDDYSKSHYFYNTLDELIKGERNSDSDK